MASRRTAVPLGRGHLCVPKIECCAVLVIAQLRVLALGVVALEQETLAGGVVCHRRVHLGGERVVLRRRGHVVGVLDLTNRGVASACSRLL